MLQVVLVHCASYLPSLLHFSPLEPIICQLANIASFSLAHCYAMFLCSLHVDKKIIIINITSISSATLGFVCILCLNVLLLGKKIMGILQAVLRSRRPLANVHSREKDGYNRLRSPVIVFFFSVCVFLCISDIFPT